MNIWGKWELSSETEERLNKFCVKISSENVTQVSSDWLALLNYKSTSGVNFDMELDATEVNIKEEEILNIIKEALQNDIILPDTTFMGVSVNSISRILTLVKNFVDETGFCSFCKFIASWSYDNLIELAMTLVVLPKLQETTEASACVIFSIKELAMSKPSQICQKVLNPLLFCNIVPYTDVELLSKVFSVLPTPQKDMLILNFNGKTEFLENDWLLLHPLIKNLSQYSLLNLLECIQKFAHKFTKSQIFGRFLVNFCKNLDLIGNKDVLKEIVEQHQTLLKSQALKYLQAV